MIYNIPYLAVAALILVGLYGVVFKRNLIKMVIGVTLIESGVNLFLITLGYRKGSTAPIYTSSPGGLMSLPVPQALTLTSIVIGVAVLALMLSFIVYIYRHYKTLDARKIGGEDE
ncbi:MAG: cation:proton antiporter [Thermoplasmata archaeon]|nr:MAG: cation:proton antiporter [Thermoplasmata archaeon]RLF34011.1 MAG: cation:proton antiporter [Thermoplasmata archaeon]RLF52830.1 MAG: cation:proton antiporter [Thermoplasmata archaeon]